MYILLNFDSTGTGNSVQHLYNHNVINAEYFVE